jgi:hypothetical protein
MDLISSQYHIKEASKLSRHIVVVSVEYYDVVVDLLITFETLAQVGSCPQPCGEHLWPVWFPSEPTLACI